MHALRHSLQIVIAVGSVLLVAGLTTEDAAGRVTLHADTGQANWFNRDCRDGEAVDVGRWFVELFVGWCDPRLRLQLVNAYPGYRLACDLYLANTGRVPLVVQAVTISNPHSEAVTVTAGLAPGEAGRLLQPCGYSPAWAANPARVPAQCQIRLNVVVQLAPDVPANARFDYAVAVALRGLSTGGGR